MFFNIDADTGRSISGWLAPDNPSATPRLVIVIPGRADIEVEAGLPRPDVRELGIHSTGLIGFSIGASLIPDLHTLDDVTLLEAQTGMPIYRRFQIGRHLERKLMLFDASLMPQRRILASMGARFALNYPSSERNSLETMIVLINNHMAKSALISGRSNFNRYSGYLVNAGYMRAAILRDPFEELAERIMFLHLLTKSEAAHLAPNFVTGVEPLVDFARDLPLSDHRALLLAFRRLNDDQKLALNSPMVRMLGCNVEETPERRNVSIALDNLASMELVGSRARYEVFNAMLTQLLGADLLGDERPTSFTTVKELAGSLSRIGLVADLLEHDLALYTLADEAIGIGLEGREDEVKRDTQSM